MRAVVLCGLVLGCVACAGQSDIVARLAALQRLHTSTTTSPVPPSRLYCGNIKKASRGPGNCAGIGTDTFGPIPAFERTEIRGWIVGGPAWSETDEVKVNIRLDWEWPAEAGIRAINTPEKMMETVTPFNVLTFGVNPTDRDGGGRALLTNASGDVWGGPNAAVVHVESQAWRFPDPPPTGWRTISQTNPSGSPLASFAVDLFRPDADPALTSDVGIGDYVRIVGTQWEDSCHCQGGIVPFPAANATDNLALGAIGRWIDGTFGHGVQVCPPPEPGHRVHCIQGRGWTELHPVDYVATFPGGTRPIRSR
jgi:hypothetical protein